MIKRNSVVTIIILLICTSLIINLAGCTRKEEKNESTTDFSNSTNSDTSEIFTTHYSCECTSSITDSTTDTESIKEIPYSILSNRDLTGRYDGQIFKMEKGADWNELNAFFGSKLDRQNLSGFTKDTLFQVSFMSPNEDGSIEDILIYKKDNRLTIEVLYKVGSSVETGKEEFSLVVKAEDLKGIKNIRLQITESIDTPDTTREGVTNVPAFIFGNGNIEKMKGRLVTFEDETIEDDIIYLEKTFEEKYFTSDALVNINFTTPTVGGYFHSIFATKRDGTLTLEVWYRYGAYDSIGSDDLSIKIEKEFLNDITKIKVKISSPIISSEFDSADEEVTFSYFAESYTVKFFTGVVFNLPKEPNYTPASPFYGSTIVDDTFSKDQFDSDVVLKIRIPTPTVGGRVENVIVKKQDSKILIELAYRLGPTDIIGYDFVSLQLHKNDIEGVTGISVKIVDPDSYKNLDKVPFTTHEEIDENYSGQTERFDNGGYWSFSYPFNGSGSIKNYKINHFKEDTLFNINFATPTKGGEVSEVSVYKVGNQVIIEIAYELGTEEGKGSDRAIIEIKKENLKNVTKVLVVFKQK